MITFAIEYGIGEIELQRDSEALCWRLAFQGMQCE
jgi:hypothetical protein